MSQVDLPRRRFLTKLTTAVGAVGVASYAWPLLASLQPSARVLAEGLPVEVDLSGLQEGQMIRVEWQKRPVYVIHRTPEMLASLNATSDNLRDPQSEKPQQPTYARNITRSIKPEYLILLAVCPHLGCAPIFRPDHPAPDIGGNWQGGFRCPCHLSKFDLSGRVFDDAPSQLNLPVPPHRYVADKRIVIG